MRASDPSLIQGIGDDVAVFETKEKALLATTDILIEEIHFEQAWIDPYHLGKKALAVNLSDIAAMGGTPRYFLLSLGLPKDLSLSFISRFYRGLREMAKPFQVDLIGGDTSLSQKIVINICLLGEGKKGRPPLPERGERSGMISLSPERSGILPWGLKILQREGLKAKPRGLIERHLSPRPRIELGQAIGKTAIGHCHDRCQRRAPDRYDPSPGGKRQRGPGLGRPDSPFETLSENMSHPIRRIPMRWPFPEAKIMNSSSLRPQK